MDNQEIVDMLIEEFSDLLVSYFIMSLFIKNVQVVKKEANCFYVGNSCIRKFGRTKINFYLHFYCNEYEWLEKFKNVLEGYVDYSISHPNHTYYLGFSLDVGSKKNSEKLMQKIMVS